jgi:hypothetical protein
MQLTFLGTRVEIDVRLRRHRHHSPLLVDRRREVPGISVRHSLRATAVG